MGTAVSLVSDQDGSGFAYYNLNGTGNVVLGDVAGGTNDSNIVKFSNNLSVVAGNGTDAVGMRAFVWTSGGGLLPLGLVGGHTTSEAWDISADGSTIVGSLLGGSGQEAFRWTSGSGTVALGLLAGGSFSEARYVSKNGSVIAGLADDATTAQAFRWTSGGGMQGLGLLGGPSVYSLPYGISGNGNVVVGFNGYPVDGEGFIWTQAAGMVGTGFLGTDTLSIAMVADYDGSNVFGSSIGGADIVAFRWRQNTSVVSIADILSAADVDSSGYQIQYVLQTSSDGRYVAGTAKDLGTLGIVAYYADLLAGGMITDEEISASLRSFTPLSEQSIQRVKVQIAESLYAARLQPMFVSPVAHYQSSLSDPSKISPAAGSEDDIGRRLSGFLVGSLSAGQDNDLDNWGVNGTAGFKFPLSDNFTVGFAVSGSQSDTDGQRDSHTKVVSKGGSLLSSYLNEQGLRLYTSLFASGLDIENRRGYYNGADLTSSYGETSGYAYGGGMRLGWEFPIVESTSIEPFIEGYIAKVHIDGYSEDNGIFPARFSDQSGISSMQKLGTVVYQNVNDKLKVSGQLSYVHLPDAENSSMVVSVAGNNFTSNGQGDTDRNWVEGGLGLQYHMNDSIGFSTEMNGRSGVAQSPEVSLTVGMSYNF
jgi:probable HAF family extracellular repeat protein